jgi:hypothetical protein
MTEKPKKERRFLKAIGRVGEILIQEVLIKIGSNLIKKIGGKKTLPSILFLLASLSLFAQYPNTGNKQRLGFQTTGDGLTWRGSESDTASIQPINNTSAWLFLIPSTLNFIRLILRPTSGTRLAVQLLLSLLIHCFLIQCFNKQRRHSKNELGFGFGYGGAWIK